MISINSTNRQKGLMMGTLLVGTFLTLLTETFFNNALPTIIKQYDVSQSIAQWVSTGYQLGVALMIPLSVWIFKRFNTRTAFTTFVGLFLVGSIFGYFANTFGILLLGRILQAIAAGSMFPLIQNVVLVIYPTNKRGTVMGMIGLVVAFGPALGPTIGGWIIDNMGLAWLSGVLIPLTLVLVMASFLFVKTVVTPENIKIDWLSVIESSLGFTALLYGFSEAGNAGHLTLQSSLAIIIGVIVIVLFAKRQLKIVVPLTNLAVFKNLIFNLSTLLSALSNIALLGVTLVLPLYMQRVHGLSAFETGLTLLPGALLEGVVSPISGRLYDKYGIKLVSTIGFGILTLGTLPMLFFTPTTSLILISGSYAFRIVGIATIIMPTFTEGLNALPPELAIHGSAISGMVRQVAGALGSAVLMMIVAFETTASPHSSEISTLNRGYWFSFFAAFLMALIGFILSFTFKSKKAS